MNYIKNEYIKNEYTIENKFSKLLWENYINKIILKGLMTKSEYRKMGYGTAIMNEFLKDSSNIKKDIEIYVHPFDIWGNFEGKNGMLTLGELEKFYGKFGFVVDHRTNDGYSIMIKRSNDI